MLGRAGMMVVTSKTVRWSGHIVRTETWISLNSDGQFWIHEFEDGCVLAVAVEDSMFGLGQEDLIVVFPVGYPIIFDYRVMSTLEADDGEHRPYCRIGGL